MWKYLVKIEYEEWTKRKQAISKKHNSKEEQVRKTRKQSKKKSGRKIGKSFSSKKLIALPIPYFFYLLKKQARPFTLDQKAFSGGDGTIMNVRCTTSKLLSMLNVERVCYLRLLAKMPFNILITRYLSTSHKTHRAFFYLLI